MNIQLQSREKKLLTTLVLVAIASGIALYFIHRPRMPGEFSTNLSEPTQQTTSSSRTNTSSRPSGGRPATTPQSSGNRGAAVTFDVFQAHRSIDNCWVLLEGRVFDISEFLRNFSDYQIKVAEFCGTVGFEAGFIQGNDTLAKTVMDNSTEMGILR